VTVLVHGFLFDPRMALTTNPADTDNPHGRAFHFVDGDERAEQREHTSGWPLHLGFGDGDGGADGLAVGFGWQSQPGFATSLIRHFQNFYARAYALADPASWVLVNLLCELHRALPAQRLDLFCHSLGARVVIRALARLAKYAADTGDSGLSAEQRGVLLATLRSLDRVLLLGGAEYVVEASLMYRRLEALLGAGLDPDQGPYCFNVVSRENDVLDVLGENFGPRTFGNSQVIGHNGLSGHRGAARWMDLQIDSPRLQQWMQDHHGIAISGDRPGNVWDHWFYYTFRGNMALYRQMLRDRDNWTIARLRADAVPEGVPLRWWDFGD
jgi:hypothetical protein